MKKQIIIMHHILKLIISFEELISILGCLELRMLTDNTSIFIYYNLYLYNKIRVGK